MTDNFTQEIKRIGGSLTIIIPANVIKFAGLEEGDTIKVMFVKVPKEK